MKLLIAKFFRVVFKIPVLKPMFFGFHQRVFKPYNLFKNLVCEVEHDGLKLKLKIDDWIQEKIYFTGEYEKAELNVLRQYLKKGGVFLDVGANLGWYSLHASKMVGENGKIISFEPFSTNYSALKTHVSINSIHNIVVERKAVGNALGTLTMYNDEQEGNLGMVTAKFVENAKKELVDVITIDNYVEQHTLRTVNFIKIDTEGFELATLEGMRKTLQNFSPKILIEILDDVAGEDNYQKVHEFLYDLGYHKFYISDEGIISSAPTCIHRKNYLFIKEKL
ncbi:FkbM family methyltransferase [Brumimicrobium aurantiacum]|uniref:FkbM family methyltransferase n=1 Tax=Brumimicrobium aurantiacum TaxID=1737063 RepID=A0A3E1EXE6_9FLAO|nr:FkbM family methyltransferase [Brumimicrobium aurantiacum]RFC54202.1 FkbM family methyltransferase [Brumimicrobium aurantiacum]